MDPPIEPYFPGSGKIDYTDNWIPGAESLDTQQIIDNKRTKKNKKKETHPTLIIACGIKNMLLRLPDLKPHVQKKTQKSERNGGSGKKK